MILPMLAKDTKGDTSVVPTAWVMEPKLDGWRWIAHVKDRRVRCFGGRNGAEWAPPPLIAHLLLHAIPDDTVLDGELIPLDTNQKSPWVRHLLAHGGDGLGYVIFDAIRWAGEEIVSSPWSHRRSLLEQLEFMQMDTVRANVVLPFDAAIIDLWVESGFEGAVCKNPNGVYRQGKRSGDWLKVKPQTTDDAVVTGWQYGKGASNKHLCGCLEIRMVGTDVETTTAFKSTPAQADAMVGRLIEIRHHGLMKSGKPRHPIFSRTRDDLEPVTSQAPKPEKPPARPPLPEVRANGASRRNYAAMGNDKLVRCARQLLDRKGDAYDRCVGAGADPAADLAVVTSVVRSRGVEVAA